jgi:hypothetical protein
VFCPVCKDEFRPGFTRCAACNADLVEDLSRVEKPAPVRAPDPVAAGLVRMVEFCGFFSLDDARSARDRVHDLGVRTDILIRESPDAERSGSLVEEYWLRVDAVRFREVEALLGDAAPEAAEPLACSACGRAIAADAVSCASCGASFEES